MRYLLPFLPLILLPAACSTPLPGGSFPRTSADGLEYRIDAPPEGPIRVAVRRSIGVGFADPGNMEQGCRRDALRIALEASERAGWATPQVDERRVSSASGRVPGPITYCTASMVVPKPS